MKINRYLICLVLFIGVLFASSVEATISAFNSTAPGNDTWTIDNTPDFTFTAVSDINTTFSCALVLNGAVNSTNSSVSNNTATIIQATSALPDSNSHQWYINCTDVNGTVSSGVYGLKVDTANPVSMVNSINGQATGGWTNTATLTINFTATDPNIKNWTLAVYDSGATLLKNWTATTSNTSSIVNDYAVTANGTYTVNLTVLDNATNSNTTSFTIKVDNANPTTSLVSPATSTWTNDTTPDFTFNYTDALSSTASCTLYVGGTAYGTNSSVSNNTNTIITANATLTEGAKAWNVTCTDLAGNSHQTAARTLTVDATAPATSLISPANGNWTNGTNSTIQFQYNYTDTQSSTASCTLYIDGTAYGTNSSVSNSTTTTIYANASITEGTKAWNVTCTDLASNSHQTAPRILNVDRTNPASVVNKVNGQNSGGFTSNSTLSVNITATDANINYWNVSVYNSTGTLITSNQTSGSNVSGSIVTLSTSANGTYSVNLTVVDNASNSNVSTFSIIVDSGNPTATLNSINGKTATGNYTNNATLTINFTATDTNIKNWTLSVYNDSIPTLVKNWTATTSNTSAVLSDYTVTANGTYTVNLIVLDNASNSAVTTWNITIDTINPSVSVSCDGTSVTVGTTITCTCTASDALSGLASQTFTSETPSTSTAGTFTSTACTATDNAGNSASASGVSYTVSSTGGGGAGGSAGGISTGVEGQFEKKVWTSILKGETAVVEVKKDAMATTKVEFKVTETAYGAWVQVKKVEKSDLSSDTKSFANKAYQYIEITKNSASLKDSIISDGKVYFRVENSWLKSNGGKDNLGLFRYNSGAWNELKTSVEKEDSTYTYYVAETPGFSYFVIGQKSAAAAPEKAAEPAKEEAAPAPSEPSAAAPAPAKAPSAPAALAKAAAKAATKSPMWIWIVAVLVVIVIIGAVYWSFKKK